MLWKIADCISVVYQKDRCYTPKYLRRDCIQRADLHSGSKQFFDSLCSNISDCPNILTNFPSD